MNPTPEAFSHSREMFEKAIALDPDYADAYLLLADVLASGYVWQFDSQPKTLDRAEVLARKAVSLDDSNSNAYAVLGWVVVLKNRPDEAIAAAERAIALDPNNAFAYGVLADISNLVGKPPGAELAYAQKAMRLDPNHPEFYLSEIGFAYLDMHHYQEAAEALKGGILVTRISTSASPRHTSSLGAS